MHYDGTTVTSKYEANRRLESDEWKKQRTPQAVASQELYAVETSSVPMMGTSFRLIWLCNQI